MRRKYAGDNPSFLHVIYFSFYDHFFFFLLLIQIYSRSTAELFIIPASIHGNMGGVS